MISFLKNRTPHYVREYRQLVKFLKTKTENEDELYERAVGGSYEKLGKAQADLVLKTAGAEEFAIVDVGCGSGRLAYALRTLNGVSYFGVDVVPELLDYAQRKCARADWKFETITALKIPSDDASANIVTFMSVFTHLKTDEVQTYLDEAYRVLKPGGAVIASYLELGNAEHVSRFRAPWRQRLARFLGRDVMISHTTMQDIRRQYEQAGFTIEDTITDDSFGQHVMIGRK